MALPRSTTSSSSYQYHLNSMIPDHYRNQFMLQDAYAAGLRASMNLGPTAWQPNWPANPHCSSDLVASSAAETSTGFHPHQLAPPGPFVPAFSPVCGSQLEKVDAVSPSYHQFSPSSSAAQAFKQDSWSANGQFSRPSVSHFLEGPLNLASMERLTNSVQRKANEHMVRPNSADLVQQLSQRLACDSNQSSPGPCLASNLARFLQFGRQEVEPLASAWSGSSNGLSTGDVAVEQSGPRTGTSPGCVAHYPFDPGFAERAARLSSLSSLMYSFSVDERDKHRVPLSVGEASPRKFVTAPSSPSQGLSSPLADSVSKRSVTFAMGSADAKGSPKNLKHELSDDSTPTRGQPDEDADRVFPSGVVPKRRQRLTHCEQAKGLDEANSGGYPVACSSPIAGKDCFHLKKRRIEIEDIPDDVSSEHQNSGRQPKIADPTTDSSPKRQKSPSIAKCSKEEMKADEGKETGNSSAKMSPKSGKEQTSQPTETPKQDFIHVRARRGQATDSHSLAERVRREKISERMRFLQDLVPGCNKITGKAMMLDEIINYVQSLQHQIEFLSMKLAALNPRVDFNIDSIFAGGEVLPPNEIGSVTETTTTSGGLSYQQMLHACLSLRDPPETFIIPTCSNGIPTETALDRAGTSFISSSLVVANNDGFSQAASAGWEGNLQGMTRGPDIDYEGRRTLFTTSDAEGDRLLGSIENVKIEL